MKIHLQDDDYAGPQSPCISADLRELSVALSPLSDEQLGELGYEVNPLWLRSPEQVELDDLTLGYKREWRRKKKQRLVQAQERREAGYERQHKTYRTKYEYHAQMGEELSRRHAANAYAQHQNFIFDHERAGAPQPDKVIPIIEGQLCKKIGASWYLKGVKNWLYRPKRLLAQMEDSLLKKGFQSYAWGYRKHIGTKVVIVAFLTHLWRDDFIWVSVLKEDYNNSNPHH